ncbi:MAG: hypothetical protein ACLRZZ_28460 [Enterocloster sp.]
MLDASYDNTASVDAQAQKQYLQERGQDVSQMTETEILTGQHWGQGVYCQPCKVRGRNGGPADDREHVGGDNGRKT